MLGYSKLQYSNISIFLEVNDGFRSNVELCMQTVQILENKFEQVLMTANVHVFHATSQRIVAWT